jgi:hypothetical protein
MRKSETVKNLFSALEQARFDEVQNYVTDDFTFRGPVPKPIKKKEWITLHKNLSIGIPNMKFNLNNLTESGNVVNGSVQLKGTQSQTLPPLLPQMQPVPPTNKAIELPKENVAFTFKGEKISIMTVEKVPNGGVPGILQQIGVNVPVNM